MIYFGLLIFLGVQLAHSVQHAAYIEFPVVESSADDLSFFESNFESSDIPLYRHIRPTITRTETSWVLENYLTTSTETLLQTSISTTFLTTSTTTLVTFPIATTTVSTTNTFTLTFQNSCTVSTTACQPSRKRLGRPIVYDSNNDEQFLIVPSAVQG